MASSPKYLAVPTDDVEMEQLSMDDGVIRLDRQPSSASAGSAEAGKRVRLHNERRRERLNTELLNAVSNKNVDQVTRLAAEGASCRATCRNSGMTALHLAAAEGDETIATYLLVNGANLTTKDRNGYEPIHMAVWNRHFAVVNMFVAHNINVIQSAVCRDEYAEDQEILDSWNHCHQQMQNLIPVELEDGVTPLHIAAMRGYYDLVKFFLEQGATVDATTEKGVTPLDVTGLHSQYEDDCKEKRRQKSELLKVSIFSKCEAPEANPLMKIYNQLMANGATMPRGKPKRSPELRMRGHAKRYTTPLHTAVMKGDCDVIRYLLNRGACLMAWNSLEETAIHLAVRENLIDPLKEMLHWNSDQVYHSQAESKVDVRDGEGMTPLLLAAQLQWSDGVALLLEEGSDVALTSNKNETVLHFAARAGNSEMLKEFLSAPNSSKVIERRDDLKYTPVSHAVESNSLECLQALKTHNANMAVVLPGNVTMLHVAVEINSPEILEFLLKDEVVKQENLVGKVCRLEKGGVAPIHVAALKGYSNCVAKLIEGGCDVNVRTMAESHRSSTAIHLAAERGHLEVLELILLRDGNAHMVRNDDSWTPLHVAAASGHSKCARTLLWCGADLGCAIRDESGRRTAVDLIMLCIPQPVEFLEEILDSYVTLEGSSSMSDENCRIIVKYDILVPDDRRQRQLKVMNAILNCGKVDTIQKLLLHPLIETFLYLKWKKLSAFFIMIMFLYLVLTVSLTVYAHLMYVEKYSSPTALLCANVASVLLISFDIIILFLEIMNLIQLHRRYIRDIESLVKWGMIILSFIVGLADPTFNWMKYVAATAVLLAWIEILFLLARCPAWGYYVLMFSRVAVNVLKVLATFSLLFVGFSFSFLILFEATEPFRNFFEATIKVLVMMLEFDYQNMFEGVKDVLALSITGRIIFISYVVLVSIVMMNLMLGLAVSDISILEAQGKTQRLVKQTQFLSLLETIVYNKTLKKLLPPKIYEAFEDKRSVEDKVIVRPAKPIESIGHSLPRSLRESIIDLIWSKTQSNDVEVTINLQDINQKIEDLADQVKNQTSSSSSSKSSFEMANNLNAFKSTLNDILLEQKAMREALKNLGIHHSDRFSAVHYEPDSIHFPQRI